tara:strand:+ start:1147 stop:1620 length:474 start_codon:yes stop_codon:yes gene_type:complete
MKQDISKEDYIIREVNEFREKGKIIGFTNGCFDLLHKGHIHLLKNCKKNCDYLIIGLNSDVSVSRLKGASRPIDNQKKRFENLISLDYVNNVSIFTEDTPIKLIEEIRPNIIFKGSDYDRKEVVGEKFVKSYGGRVELISIIKGISTTNIIKTKEKY